MTREVETCDVCQRETNTYDACTVCGAEMCVLCKGLVPGCIVDPGVCKKCALRKDVVAACAKWAKEYRGVNTKRLAELRKLPAQAPVAVAKD